MFQGATELNLDAKGRLAIPARYRDALAPDSAPITLVAHTHRCLCVYSQAVWAPIRDRIASLPDTKDIRIHHFKLKTLGRAQEDELDGAGRVLISKFLREYAGLDKQVWLVGMGNRFDLWSDAGWQAQQEAMLAADDGDLPEELEGFVL
jgi:MraZ protein